MGLPIRLTFNDKDFVFEIIDSKLITKDTNDLKILVKGEEVELSRNAKMIWSQKSGGETFDPALVQAIGRSISLRLRM